MRLSKRVSLVGLLALASCGALREKEQKLILEEIDYPTSYQRENKLRHPIEIIGGEEFTNRVYYILDELHRRDKERYDKVVRYIKIVANTGCSQLHIKTGVLTIGNRFTDNIDDLVDDMGVFVHEMRHIECLLEGKPYQGREGERLAMEEQNHFLIEQNWNKGMIDVESALDTKYWMDESRVD